MVRKLRELGVDAAIPLEDGTFARNQPMPNSMWVDDLYMSVPCLAQMGRITRDRRYFDDAAKQILQFHSRMFVQKKTCGCTAGSRR